MAPPPEQLTSVEEAKQDLEEEDEEDMEEEDEEGMEEGG